MASNGLAAVLEHVDREVSAILHRALAGEELSWTAGLRLCETNGLDFQAVCSVADEMRRRQVGEIVTYVVNRNINFTNVCIKHCTFYAFSREYRQEEGYFLPTGRDRASRAGSGRYGSNRSLHASRPRPRWMAIYISS